MILLDTHAPVWAIAKSERLSRAAAAAIRKPRAEDGLAIAAITLRMLAVLAARRRIQAYGTVDASVRLLIDGVTVKPLTPEIAGLATQFPDDYPCDPADRLIGGTARAEGLALVTQDVRIRHSALLKIIW